MVGTEQAPLSDGAIRRDHIAKRHAALAQYMRDGTPINVIAQIMGLEANQVRKTCRLLAAEHGIEYKPVRRPGALPPGMTDASRSLRNHLADRLHEHHEGRHRLQVCVDTGLTQSELRAASERPNAYDWSLSEMERIATATNQDFTVMLLKGLFTKTRFEKVMRCLNS